MHLEEDLTEIGCIGLISKPWTVKDEKMVQEILTGVPNQYDLIVREKSKIWTIEKWREAYGFLVGGKGFASRTDKFINGNFWNPVNPKDGFAIADCADMQAKRVL